MKTSANKTVFLLSVVLFISSLSSNISAAEKTFLESSSEKMTTKLVTLSVGEFPPRYSQTGNSIFLDIVSAAFYEVGIDVKYNFHPWARVIKNVEFNIEDGSATWRKNKEREAIFYFSDPVYTSRSVAFHLKNRNIKWDILEDLSGLKIGTTRSLYFGDKFSKLEESGALSVSRVSKDIQNYKMLISERIDIFLQQPDLTYYQMRQHLTKDEYDQITHHPKTVHEFDLHLILSKRNKENSRIIQDFNKGLAVIKNNGVYKKLMDKYNQILRGEQ
jgi:polar amino acid transport system substrate-binding protein